jgi:hypothetical protein
MSGTNADLNTNLAASSKIAASLWGNDSALPANIVALLDSDAGHFLLVNVAATDIRPEDGAFAQCRVNSLLGASTAGGGLSDNLDGLGYGTKAAGVCPTQADAAGFKSGSNIVSAITTLITTATTAATANVVAFNVSGRDPFAPTTGTLGTIPAYTTYPVGAAPVVFITERDKGQLNNVTNATEHQLQTVFSGANCAGNAFDGGAAGAINVFLREPLSGTMNTTEATVFRRPTVYPNSPGVLGVSQETGVNPSGGDNPLNKNCVSGGGNRWRAIGTGEAVGGVKNSGGVNLGGNDGIGYTFFSYGNISSIAGVSNYGYLRLNGVDPIFQIYGSTFDGGQPAIAGALPAESNLPATCPTPNHFPCAENLIWKNGFSFPNLRNGTYRAWSLLRLVATTGKPEAVNVANMRTLSNKVTVQIIPDYVPQAAVAGTTDLGLKLVRSHYQQKDGNSVLLGPAPVNAVATEHGGDMGGFIIPTTIGATTASQLKLVQNATNTANTDNANVSPVVRP